MINPVEVLKRLEPGSEVFESNVFVSIAISLKRIADVMERRFHPAQANQLDEIDGEIPF